MFLAEALLILANVGLVVLNAYLIKERLAILEAKALRSLRRYRSTKLGRLYRKAVGKKAGDVLAFPNQHYIDQTLVA